MNGEHYRPKERTDGLYEGLENVLMKAWASQVKNVYDRGYEDGYQDGKAAEETKRDQITDKAYNDGMSKAWWVAETIMDMPTEDRYRVFGDRAYYNILVSHTPSTVITMLERYERDKEIAAEQESMTIEVGDEVICECPNRQAVVVVAKSMKNLKDYTFDITIMRKDGSCYSRSSKGCTKTGRHFPQIAKVLESLMATVKSNGNNE